MKSCRELWRNRKIWWKKYQVAVWMEVIFLAVAAVASGCLYRVERNRQLETARNALSQSHQQIYLAAEDTGHDEIRKLVTDLMSETVNEKGHAVYAIQLNLYTRAGSSSGVIGEQEMYFAWSTNTEEGIQTEYYTPSIYFSEAEMDGFFDFYKEYGSSQPRRNCYIRQVTGYYTDGGTFYPIEIIFGDHNDEEESYVLRNERAAGNVSEEKLVCRVSDIAIEDLEDPGQVEIGSLSMNLYAAQGDVVCTQPYYEPQTTYGLVTGTVEEETSCSDTECFWTRRVGSNPSIGGYCCSMNADVGQMIRDGGNLKRLVAPVWGYGQCFAAVLIILYLYIRKKKEKLAEMQNTFLNAIAHEMKTPAAVLKNTAECVREGIHPEKQEHYMEIIGQEADHMNELLNSMLIYTRVTDTFYQLQKEECFLETMAREVSRHYQDVLEKKQISLIWDVDQPLAIRCDRKLMEMVVDNLFSNAVKFCRQGGVIRISLTGSAIRVYNEGEEIPAEEMERIWEPLYRADPSRAYEAGSSGMGLAISAAALKLHGADYGVKNVSGGVEFYVKL